MSVDLDDLIKHSSKPLEIIRGLVIKKDLEGKSRKEIESFMSKGPSFISKRRSIYMSLALWAFCQHIRAAALAHF